MGVGGRIQKDHSMKYELTESNVKDLIEWLRGGHINRAVIALEHLRQVDDLAAKVEPVAWKNTFDDLLEDYAMARVETALWNVAHIQAPGSIRMTRPRLNALTAHLAASPQQAEAPSREAICGAVARGWCHPNNSMKIMDYDLAFEIVAEVVDLLAAPRSEA